MRLWISIPFFMLSNLLFGQASLGFSLSHLDYQKNGQDLKFGDFGGLNAPQFQEVDFNNDGHLDLVILERVGNYVAYLAWNPTLNEYEMAPGWGNRMPLIQNWFQLIDYNCDGTMDLFASANGGIEAYKNTGSNSLPVFILEKELIYSSANGNPANLFIFSSDITAMQDVDGDQDVDILSFSLNNNEFVELHLNQSQELGYNCDSLIYELHSMCWGQFRENSLDNVISLNENCTGPGAPPVRHAGSSLTLLDYDGNGALDLLLGDISFPELKLLMNAGTSVDAQIDQVVDQFPVLNPVDLYNFPAAFLIDINHDSKKDLVVASANRSLYNNFEGVWYYENVAPSLYDFQFQKNNLFQGDMIDVGEGALLHFEDLNNDGLGDLLISTHMRSDGNGITEYPMVYYQNTGTASVPQFTWITDDFAGLSSFNLNASSQCTWGDLNNDLLKDLVIGNIDGTLQYLINTGSAGAPSYALAQGPMLDQQGSALDVGQFASPQLVDLDNDGDLDLLVGNKTGNISFYRNNGNNSSPVWTLESNTWKDINVKQPFDLYGYATLQYKEINGQNYLCVGSFSGANYVYHVNKGADPDVVLVDHELNNQYIGTRTKAVLCNLNNDAFPDALVSNYRGGINAFLGKVYSGQEEKTVSKMKLYPNPSSGVLHIEGLDGQNGQLYVYNLMGVLVRTINLEGASVHLDLSDLSVGHYILQSKQYGSLQSWQWLKQ